MSIKTFARSRWGKVAAALILIAGITIPVTQVMGATGTDPNCPNDGYGRDCNDNSLIYGGVYTKTEFLNQFDANKDRVGHTDLQAIYGAQGVTHANFASADTVPGVVYKNGDVKVNGVTVATNTWSSGRQYEAGSIAKDGVYFRPEQVAFIADSIPAWINMNGKTFNYAVIMSCGNTVVSSATPFGQIYKRVTDVTTDPTHNYAADTNATAITVNPGDTVKYQVRIDNNGYGDMTNTVMTDTLPTGVALSNGGDGHLVANFGTVKASSAVEADITVKVTKTTEGYIDNEACFTASNGQSGCDHAVIHVVPKATPTPTATPTPSMTPTPTPKPTPTPTVTPTPTPTPVEEFSCGGLAITPKSVGSLEYTFTITPVTKNVTVTGYIYVVKNDKGVTVATLTSGANHNSVGYTFPSAGNYSVTGQVVTNRGTTPVVELCSANVTAGPTVTPTPTPTPGTPTPTPTPCTTPETGTTGEVCGASTGPSTLPATGGAALGGIGGIGAIGYATRAYLLSKKSLIDSLRNK